MDERQHQSIEECSRFDNELRAFLEGETRPFIEVHAQDCGACRALLADLRAIRQAARELPLETPSRAVWDKVRATLEADGAFVAPACARFDAELQDSLEGEVRPFIASHARDCAPCGALLADVQAIRQAARDLPQEQPSSAVWASLRAKLQAEGAFAVPGCAQFEAELEDYLEGEARPFIMAHAQDCVPCGAMLADLQSIREAARALPQEEPSRVVWANIRARLEAEGAFGAPVSGWRQILAWRIFPHAIPLGVLAALVILGSLVTWRDVQRLGNSEGAAHSATVAAVTSALPAADIALAHVVSDLEKNFRANEASMTPDLKATYEKSLVSLDGSIRECLDSLQHEPRNTLAHDFLLTAYTRKAEVLSSALEFDGR